MKKNKNQKTKIKNKDQIPAKGNKLSSWKVKLLKILSHFFANLTPIIKLFGIIIIFFLLFINIILSQKIDPLYLGLINNDKKATIDFLKKIKTQPYFPQELEKYKKIYGKTIEEEVFTQERQRKRMIKNLEQILEKNQKARDVLYGLFLLYEEDGDKTKAMEYLKRAKEVDPNIENSKL